ncbi:hypothetical protein LOTGIDRAFT_166847 [Lottia gigantea]|uniref:Dual oxidase maturation factor 1 n=1 Tax=Lottia gigantea TaxID=225164 RepID=V3Z7Q7_LOTGI|nr:hypothetical protein LOTGIDRAFT_166847 [Lottia gigantea]ESO86843.1 hypothetical protein LOTGIDRAFT_166847 [Lottia gigantea]
MFLIKQSASIKFKEMGWFEAFRNQQGYTWYNDRRTAALFDIPLAAVTYFCTLVAIAVVIATLGIRGKEKWGAVVRTFYGVAVGSVILVSLYGHCWLMGKVHITSSYIYRSRDQFSGDVGIEIGLHSANVTLRGYFGEVGRRGEVIYSEALPWADYGKEEGQMESYLSRGLPDPILRVAAYLCTDSGGLRWARGFHMAGNLSCILLWTAFAFWILTNILLFSVIVYGAYSMVLTGITMLLASIVYHVCQPSQSLAVHFDDVVLRTSYGWCFWLTLVTGGLTIVIGTVLLLVDHFMPKKTAEFFRVEISIGDEERYDSLMSLNDPGRKQSVYTIGDNRRASIFSTNQNRRTSIFTDTPVRRISPSSWGSSINPNQAISNRSTSSPAIFKFESDKIVEEDEENREEKKDNNTKEHVHVTIDPETSSNSDKASVGENHVVHIEDKRLDDSKITTSQYGVTTINIGSDRTLSHSSDSGNEGSENNSSFHQLDVHSLNSTT